MFVQNIQNPPFSHQHETLQAQASLFFSQYHNLAVVHAHK